MPAAGERFEIKPFRSLSGRELHDLLRLRQDVFVVEQDCPYPDIDGRDPEATHILGWRDDTLVACARWFTDGAHTRVGRIATSEQVRGEGIGKALMREALAYIGPGPVVLDAQSHLQGFYVAFGFSPRGEEFLEDGIPHIQMVREP